jgi:AraC family transcriptional regulator of adaptative response/methylated-DNA-[protein]-cysteine methyltransferase
MTRSEGPPGLDPAACDRARLARDPAFDGIFFTGVRTTRIYCRPICPVRPARSENVVFFPTAAAAERAGFRPCLRCRPEAAPGSPAWAGTATTVGRGLRLISEGFLDRHSVAELAETLGIGPRHLLRLFLRHAGATPTQVATTQRIQRAKRLIDRTDLPLSEIALAAGFNSVRRFNDAFRTIYKRPPSSFRRSSAQGMAVASGAGVIAPRPGGRPPLKPSDPC